MFWATPQALARMKKEEENIISYATNDKLLH